MACPTSRRYLESQHQRRNGKACCTTKHHQRNQNAHTSLARPFRKNKRVMEPEASLSGATHRTKTSWSAQVSLERRRGGGLARASSRQLARNISKLK